MALEKILIYLTARAPEKSYGIMLMKKKIDLHFFLQLQNYNLKNKFLTLVFQIKITKGIMKTFSHLSLKKLSYSIIDFT